MKILFLSDNFPPEVNAPAIRTFEHCREWVHQGEEVTVLTCAPNFPKGKLFSGYKNKLSQVEFVDAIRIVRVWSYMASNSGIIKRSLDYFSFAFMAFLRGLFLKTDCIIATSPQFFTIIAGYFLAVFKRKRYVIEIRDLWPESIQAIGAIRNGTLLRFLETIELFLYKRADQIIVVTDSFKQNMVSRGIDPDKIFIVKNGFLKEKLSQKSPDNNLAAQLGIPAGKPIVGYIGTHGLSHALDFIIRVSADLEKEVYFLFIGEGAEKESLLALKQSISAENVIMIGNQPQQEIFSYLSLIDISLVNLKKSDTFKTVIPSKIFESAAFQKPILLGVEGEAQELIEHYSAGLAFEPENPVDFVKKLNRLIEDHELYNICQIGCTKLAEDFGRKKLALKLLSIISKDRNYAK